MIKFEIKFDKELFRFSSFDNWVKTAGEKFDVALEKENLIRPDLICIDTVGRICAYGLHFQRAEDEKTFPVICYKIV